MTKDEALLAIAQGQRVTHEYFTGEEWVEKSDLGLVFEDGVECTKEEFFKYRDDLDWHTGWGLYTPNTE